jgi:hypothetical protein
MQNFSLDNHLDHLESVFVYLVYFAVPLSHLQASPRFFKTRAIEYALFKV